MSSRVSTAAPASSIAIRGTRAHVPGNQKSSRFIWMLLPALQQLRLRGIFTYTVFSLQGSQEATDGEQMIGNRLIHRGGAGYEEARVAGLFHRRHPERYPAAVLHAESEDDVVLGVREARERGWTVTVRSGGHSFPVWSLRDDALLIDLGGFKEISLEPDTGVVSITPSVQSAELNAQLAEHGLFFGSGGCPTIGLGGFLLQGGVGYGFRGWGYAAEQVVTVDVVTADGELVRADAHRNSDLFWAARGA